MRSDAREARQLTPPAARTRRRCAICLGRGELIRGQTRLRQVEHLAVPDSERLDPALLAEGQRDEVAELGDLLV
jgi:hypothetical protein